MNKNLLLTFLLIGITVLSFGQAITITPADSVSVTEEVTTMGDEVVLYAYVTNDSSEDLTINWRIIDQAYPLSWSVSYCDNTNCLDLSSANQSDFILKSDSTSILKMAYLPFLNAGTSDIEVSVSIVGVPGSAVSVKYHADVTANPVGITEIDAKSLSLFPNPTTNQIQIKGLDNVNQVETLEIYSIIGKKVLQKPIGQLSDLKVDVRHLDNGVYMVKLFDKTKNLFYTKTFVKQ